MSTSTPRLQLTKPAGVDSMANGWSTFADAWTKVDAAIGVNKVTSQSAVASPFVGDLIYETSTSKSKIYNSGTWEELYASVNGRGNPQNGTWLNDMIVEGSAETFVTNFYNLSVKAGRKYKVDFNISVSAIIPDINPTPPYHGTIRNDFRYTTSDLSANNTLIHDMTTYITHDTDAASKNIRGMFEFFPNWTGTLYITHTVQILSGNEYCKINLSGATSSLFMVDWGV